MELSKESWEDLRLQLNIAGISLGFYASGRLLGHAKELGLLPIWVYAGESLSLLWLVAIGFMQAASRHKDKESQSVYPWMRTSLMPAYVGVAIAVADLLMLIGRAIALAF